MSSGEYTEQLPCGGKLIVTTNSSEVTYYFPGRDRRHNGEFVNIRGKDIRQYMKAFAENWNEYQSLKKSIPPGGDFSKKGKMGMTIRVDKYGGGVYIRHYHMRLDTKEKVAKVINSLDYAIKRTPQVRELLNKL